MTKLWGGRFGKKMHPLAEEFTKSIQFDYKLAKYDVIGSMLHVKMLEKVAYLTSEEAKKLEEVLKSILDSLDKGNFKFDQNSEDIHTDIQNKLQKEVGEAALKLHMARSRNDQVVFATKLYCKAEIENLKGDIDGIISSIKKLAQDNKDTIIPGFTHLQHAQPVYLKDYLGAYLAMLQRDKVRLESISQNLKITLGAGALAGTPISASEYNLKVSEFLREEGLDEVIKPTTNSLDTVSDRDFVIETLCALSMLGMHLSRLSEDLIIWSTKEFDFVEIDEAFCTGSSLMPQKKNPDVLELIRGSAARLSGNLVSVLAMMKGLPLTYNRDMQLDKEPLFGSFELISKELEVLIGLIKTLKFNKLKIEEHLKDESLYATDLVYYLVDKKLPFKEAHTIVGKLVRYSVDNDIEIKKLPKDKLKQFSDKFVKDEIVELFNPTRSVESKKSIER